MADQKITQLTADTTPTADDLVVTVNDPAGTPANKKVAVGDLLNSKLFTNPYKFSVYRNSAANTGNGAFAVIAFDTANFDTGSNVSLSTGVFTAPVAGFYQFNARASFTSTRGIISLFRNGSEASGGLRGSDSTVVSSDIGVVAGGLIKLAANDTVDVRVFGATTVALDVGNNGQVTFTGFLVSAT